MKKKIAVISRTHNSSKSIKNSINAAQKLTKEIVIVDSFSSDNTVNVCKKLGCKVYRRKFNNYSDQRNWIIKKINKNYLWQLHLDSDEILDELAIQSIKNAILSKKKNSYIIKRQDYFLNKKLNFSGLNPWHLRLFRSGTAICEHRLYDQHFISNDNAIKIDGFIHDMNNLKLYEWKKKHIKWSKLEAINFYLSDKNKKLLKGRFGINRRERTRFYKNLYYHLPIKLRVYIYFIYRLIFKLGILDLKIGLIFCYYHAFWFRMLVDKEILKIKKKI